MIPDLRTASPILALIHLKFMDFALQVETNSLRAATRLRSYFQPHLAVPIDAPDMRLSAIRAEPEYDPAQLMDWERSAGKRPPKESYYDHAGTRHVLKNRTGMLIQLRDGEAAIIGDVDRHLNQVINLVGTLFGLSLVDRGYVMLHASAVVRSDSDEATIFLGNSGSGKSSLALQFVERGGFDYLSNDRVLLKSKRDGIHVVGLPKKPRVNPGTLMASERLSRLLPARKRSAYKAMEAEALWHVEDKHDVDVRRTLGAKERLDGRLTQAFSLEWRPDGRGLQTDALLPEEVLAALRQTSKDFGAFDLRLDARDAAAEHRRIARAVPFTAVLGRTNPARLVREITSPSRASALMAR